MWDGGKGMAPHSAEALYYSVLYYSLSSALAGWSFVIFSLRHLSPPGRPKAAVLAASGSDGPVWDRPGCDSRCHRHVAHAHPKHHGPVPSGSQSPLCPPSPRSRAPGPRGGPAGGARRARPRAASHRLPPHSRRAPAEGSRRARVTFHGHGLQDAELLEHGDEQQDHYGHGAQLHALDTHGGPRAASEAPGRCSRRLLGRPRLTCPQQAGPRVSAGLRPRAGRRRRAGSGPVVGRGTAAERNFLSQPANFDERQPRGPETPPCPARAPRLSCPLCSPAGAGARGSRALPAAQPPSRLPARSLA